MSHKIKGPKASCMIILLTLSLASLVAASSDLQLVEAVDKIALAVSGMDRKVAADVVRIQRDQYPRLKQIAWASRSAIFSRWVSQRSIHEMPQSN